MHIFSIQDVEVIGWNNLLETATPTIVASKQIYFVSYQIGSMTSETFRRYSIDLGLCPSESLSVEHMEILEVLVSRMTSEQIKFVAQDSHGMGISGHR